MEDKVKIEDTLISLDLTEPRKRHPDCRAQEEAEQEKAA